MNDINEAFVSRRQKPGLSSVQWSLVSTVIKPPTGNLIKRKINARLSCYSLCIFASTEVQSQNGAKDFSGLLFGSQGHRELDVVLELGESVALTTSDTSGTEAGVAPVHVI